MATNNKSTANNAAVLAFLATLTPAQQQAYLATQGGNTASKAGGRVNAITRQEGGVVISDKGQVLFKSVGPFGATAFFNGDFIALLGMLDLAVQTSLVDNAGKLSCAKAGDVVKEMARRPIVTAVEAKAAEILKHAQAIALLVNTAAGVKMV